MKATKQVVETPVTPEPCTNTVASPFRVTEV